MDSGIKRRSPTSSDCGKIPVELFPVFSLHIAQKARPEEGLFLCPVEDVGFPGQCRPK